jgi:hypothetical protein
MMDSYMTDITSPKYVPVAHPVSVIAYGLCSCLSSCHQGNDHLDVQRERFTHKMRDGWGLATDGKVLFGSDGSSKLYRLDPKSLEGYIVRAWCYMFCYL